MAPDPTTRDQPDHTCYNMTKLDDDEASKLGPHVWLGMGKKAQPCFDDGSHLRCRQSLGYEANLHFRVLTFDRAFAYLSIPRSDSQEVA